jgi:hypothetical protein
MKRPVISAQAAARLEFVLTIYVITLYLLYALV